MKLPLTTPLDLPSNERPGKIVEAFLAALESRDLPGASRYLALGAALIFPGNRVFTSLQALVAWSATRYRFVRKTCEQTETLPGHACGLAVVYCRGTLAGEWPDGTAFAGVRFIDRFEIDADGRIVDQQVWNDLGEARR